MQDAIDPKKNPNKKPDFIPIIKENVPSYLRERNQWVRWKWELRNNSKWDKPPIQLNGRNASPTRKEEWTSFEAVCKSKVGDGIGYVMQEDDKLIGIDLDNVRNPQTGEILEKAQWIIDELAGYTEVSPSGTGVKIWLRGEHAEKAWKKKVSIDEFEAEVYSKSRYFTVTTLRITDVREIPEAGKSLQNFLATYFLKDDFARMERSCFDPSWTRYCAVGMEGDKEIGALWVLDPDMGYHDWLNVLMALSSIGDDMFDAADQWSSKGTKYPGPEAMFAKWESLPKSSGAVHAGSLFRRAMLEGWAFPKRGYEMSEMGMAQRVADSNEDNFWWVPTWGYWVRWDGTRYVKSEGGLKERIHALAMNLRDEAVKEKNAKEKDIQGMKKSEKKDQLAPIVAKIDFYNRFGSNRVLSSTEVLCREKMCKNHQEFNKFLHILPLSNGVYDLEQQEYFEHSKEYLNTFCSSVPYIEHEDCPRWEKFMEEITCGDVALQNYLRAICGYCLSGSTKMQKMFVLIGDGANGKSVFANIFRKVLGEQLAGPMSQKTLTQNGSQDAFLQMTYLYGKRVVVAQETDLNCRLCESQVKELTGSDDIQCRGHYQDLWSFKPSHKIILATNHVPRIQGTDEGIWRRIALIPFSATFRPDQQEKDLPETLDVELPGILQWFIKGWGEYKLFGAEEPLCVSNARTAYRKEMNIIEQWMEDCCEFGEKCEAEFGDLYRSFAGYCKDCNYFPILSTTALGRALNKHPGVEDDRTKKSRMKKGIGLKKHPIEDAS